MTDVPRLDDPVRPCAECDQPASGYESVRHGTVWTTKYYCRTHSTMRARAQREAHVRALSRNLTWTPEEFMGREGHMLMLGGPFVQTMEDPEAPPELVEWCAGVLDICGDLPRREALQRQYLSPEELDAARHYSDNF